MPVRKMKTPTEKIASPGFLLRIAGNKWGTYKKTVADTLVKLRGEKLCLVGTEEETSFFKLSAFIEQGYSHKIKAELIAYLVFVIEEEPFSLADRASLMKSLSLLPDESQNKLLLTFKIVVKKEISAAEKQLLLCVIKEITGGTLARANVELAAKELEVLEAAGCDTGTISERARFLLWYHLFFFREAGLDLFEKIVKDFKKENLPINLALLQAIVRESSIRKFYPGKFAREVASAMREDKKMQDRTIKDIIMRSLLRLQKD